MPDIDAARRFVALHARLLDRARFAHLIDGAPAEPILRALAAYANDDGGFGHALEPDIRGPESEPAATMHALCILADVGAADDPMFDDAAAWIASISEPDGGVPFMLPEAAAHPRAPYFGPPQPGGSFLTFAIAGALIAKHGAEPWVQRMADWCWAELEHPEALFAYAIKYALGFLDRTPERARAEAAIEGLRPRLQADGTLPVTGGEENERLTPLMLSERPDLRSRALFTDKQIEADLERIEREQQGDGGWTFDHLAWSPGQSVEYRGIETLRALSVLHAYGRLEVAGLA